MGLTAYLILSLVVGLRVTAWIYGLPGSVSSGPNHSDRVPSTRCRRRIQTGDREAIILFSGQGILDIDSKHGGRRRSCTRG